MEDHIVAKLRAELERGITTEPQVVFVMVKTRKLLDLNNYKATPPDSMLRLCCDWCVHTELSGPHAQDIVKRMDAIYPRMLGATLTDEDKAYMRHRFSFDRFRDELNQFFDDQSLPPFPGSQWNVFLTGFLNTVEDCSLKCGAAGANLTNVDEVVLLQHGRTSPKISDGSAPPMLWGLCFRRKLKFPMIANTRLSTEAIEALVEFEQRREQSDRAHGRFHETPDSSEEKRPLLSRPAARRSGREER
jgi:hypothetical protein